MDRNKGAAAPAVACAWSEEVLMRHGSSSHAADRDRAIGPAIRRGGFLFLAIGFLASPAGVAGASQLEIQGNVQRGTYFSDACPGAHLVGFWLTAGYWVNQIGILCAPFLSSEGRFGDEQTRQGFGTQVGMPQRAYCPKDHFLGGIMFGYTREGDDPLQVDFVELACRPLAGGAATRVCMGTGGGCYAVRPGAPDPFVTSELPSYVQSCPEDEAAVGLHGKAGNSVYALGLICGPKPGVLPSSADCKAYARTAVTAAAENDQYRCRNTGVRWSGKAADHFAWCSRLDASWRQTLAAETAARGDALKRCLAMGQAIPQPSVPVDVTRPTEPEDLGIRTKPRRNVFK